MFSEVQCRMSYKYINFKYISSNIKICLLKIVVKKKKRMSFLARGFQQLLCVIEGKRIYFVYGRRNRFKSSFCEKVNVLYKMRRCPL